MHEHDETLPACLADRQVEDDTASPRLSALQKAILSKTQGMMHMLNSIQMQMAIANGTLLRSGGCVACGCQMTSCANAKRHADHYRLNQP